MHSLSPTISQDRCKLGFQFALLSYQCFSQAKLACPSCLNRSCILESLGYTVVSCSLLWVSCCLHTENLSLAAAGTIINCLVLLSLSLDALLRNSTKKQSRALDYVVAVYKSFGRPLSKLVSHLHLTHHNPRTESQLIHLSVDPNTFTMAPPGSTPMNPSTVIPGLVSFGPLVLDEVVFSDGRILSNMPGGTGLYGLNTFNYG